MRRIARCRLSWQGSRPPCDGSVALPRELTTARVERAGNALLPREQEHAGPNAPAPIRPEVSKLWATPERARCSE